jgi:hypothetical protein
MSMILFAVERGHLKHRFLIFLEPCTKDAIQSWALSACTIGPYRDDVKSAMGGYWSQYKSVFCFFFNLTAQFTDQDVCGHHILVLLRHKCFCLIIHALGI